ncbi:MAG: cofactor-independent phosphoglycerate mutase [Spirochaetes bacterium RBG_16_49_21]|nr:MAG: cofactor-independent phosphoglycerate mutase [Spirochaetes bacterium RBG_16_49_21]
MIKSNTKYAILLGDGMADLPIESLGRKTPLEYANTPNMDRLAGSGILGMVRTVPEGMQPGSDIANLSILGYDPRDTFCGRAPLEAINMGIDLGTHDIAIRCNMVEVHGGIMHDFSADHIDSALSAIIMKELAKNNSIKGLEFYPGVSYRNVVVWRGYRHDDLPVTTPPHDIQEREAGPHLPSGSGADILNRIMIESAEIIASSPAIRDAKSRYRGTPTQVWLWGCGRRPSMEPLAKRFGLTGYTISAVDLIHGIGRAAGLTPLPVPGATGYIDTNYAGKADALLKAMEAGDTNFVFLHVESPDESGHEGNLEHKIRAIEDFDRLVVGRVLDGISAFNDYSILVLADHPTPIKLRTHTADPVPFCLFSTGGGDDPSLRAMRGSSFSERSAQATGLLIPEGHRLIELMLHKKL